MENKKLKPKKEITKEEAGQIKQGKKIILWIVVIFAVWIFFSSGGGDDKETIKEKDVGDCVGAYVMSQEYVKEVLKSPSTAKFGWGSSNYECKTTGHSYFTITSHVDSQNSFGAMMRTEFIVGVQYTGDDMWRLRILVFDGKVLYSTEE